MVGISSRIGDKYDISGNVNGCLCLRKEGKLNYMRIYRSSVPTNYKMSLNAHSSCSICGKVCTSAGELNRGANVLKTKPEKKVNVSHSCKKKGHFFS